MQNVQNFRLFFLMLLRYKRSFDFRARLVRAGLIYQEYLFFFHSPKIILVFMHISNIEIQLSQLFEVPYITVQNTSEASLLRFARSQYCFDCISLYTSKMLQQETRFLHSVKSQASQIHSKFPSGVKHGLYLYNRLLYHTALMHITSCKHRTCTLLFSDEL